MTSEKLLSTARKLGIQIATAESCTGGMIAAALTDIPGSSDVFDRGFVTYSNAAKQEMLGVSAKTLQSFGAVSEEVAREMADGALVKSNAQLAVSVTGIAGPGGSEHKPEGRVCFGLAYKGQGTVTKTIDFGAAGRTNVREKSVNYAIEMMLSKLS